MVYHPIIYSVIVTNGQEFLPSVGGDGWKGWQLCMNISGRTWDVPSMPSWLVVYADFPLWFSPQVANQRWCWAAWCWAPWTDITNLTAVSMTIADPPGFSWFLFPMNLTISVCPMVSPNFKGHLQCSTRVSWRGFPPRAFAVEWWSRRSTLVLGMASVLFSGYGQYGEGKMTHFPGLLQPSSTLYITYIYYIYILYIIYMCVILLYIFSVYIYIHIITYIYIYIHRRMI